jgi:hypothetical protein
MSYSVSATCSQRTLKLTAKFHLQPLSLPDGEDPEGFHDGNEAGAGPKLLHVLRVSVIAFHPIPDKVINGCVLESP